MLMQFSQASDWFSRKTQSPISDKEIDTIKNWIKKLFLAFVLNDDENDKLELL